MSRFAYIENWDMAKGNPKDWDLAQEAQTHHVASEFAKAYVVDFVQRNACIRLGITPEGDLANDTAHRVKNHPLTQEYIAKLVKKFSKTKHVTNETVMAKIWEVANDPVANDNAKLGALKLTAEILGMKIDKKEVDVKGINPVINLTTTA